LDLPNLGGGYCQDKQWGVRLKLLKNTSEKEGGA